MTGMLLCCGHFQLGQTNCRMVYRENGGGGGGGGEGIL